MADPQTLLKASDLSVRRGGRNVLDGASLELRAGEVTAVMGPNGAGKSTLVAALAGLLDLDAGSVNAHGRVAAILQNPDLADRSALANVEAALAWWGVARRERRARALAALERMGAADLADRHVATLSGGEARRVHIARGLAVEADVLLVDEPFAGLDAPTRGTLLHDSAAALRDPSRATLVVVHDAAEAWALADRLLVLLDGRVAAAGGTAEVMGRPPTLEAARFLGFTGSVDLPSGRVLALRPTDVSLSQEGGEAGVVTAVMPTDAGALCTVRVPGGSVQVQSALPAPAVGDAVAVSVSGGVEYPGGDA